MFSVENYEGFSEMLEEALEKTSWCSIEDLKRQYDVRIKEYGYVHDTGFDVVFEDRVIFEDSETYGRGWESIKELYENAVAYAEERWSYCVEYGYH